MDFNDSNAIRQAISKISSNVLKEQSKSCFRIYKATIKTAPNGTTCGVCLSGETTVLNLPYSSAIKDITEGSMVWVASIYDSLSNGIVWLPYNFDYGFVGENYVSAFVENYVNTSIRHYTLTSVANTYMYIENANIVGCWLINISTTENDEGSALIALSNNSAYNQSIDYIEGTRIAGSSSYYEQYYPTVSLYNGRIYFKYSKSNIEFNITVVGIN